MNFIKKLSSAVLLAAAALVLIAPSFLLTPRTVQAESCSPLFLVRPSQNQAGSDGVIVKPADAKKVYLDVKFSLNGPSTCQGPAYVVAKWNNAKTTITNNVDKVFNYTSVPAREGVYRIELQIPNSGFGKEVTVTVADDVLHPPAGGIGTENGSHVQPTDKPTNGSKGGFVPCGNTADNPCQIGHLFSAFIVIINYLMAMAGFVAVLAIIFAGFMMIYSQGQEKLKEAKGRFTGAIFGLVLVAAAFVLINSLFAGSLSIGVKDGGKILSDPLEYINTRSSTTNSNTR